MDIIKDGNITYIKDNKFKTNQIKIAFMFFNNKDYLKYILLANCLFSGTRSHPTKRDLNEYIENLYDASLSISYKTFGEMGEFYFYSSFVMDKYAYQGITKDIISLIYELLTKPNFDCNKQFKDEVFLREKMLLKQSLEREFDNKYGYAYKKLLQLNSIPKKYNISAYADVESLMKITKADIMKAYYELLNNKKVCVYIYGDVNLDDFSVFKNKELVTLPKTIFDFSLEPKPEKFIKAKTKQTILGISYITKVDTYDEKKRHAMFLFNSIFGGNSNSLLFRIVREKHSLCYTITSNYNPFDSSINVIVGLDKEAKDEALSLIKAVLEMIKQDDYKEEIYQNAKKMMISSILDSQDNVYTVLAREEMKYVYQKNNSLASIIKMYKEVSRKDICEMASLLQKDIVLTLGANDENI